MIDSGIVGHIRETRGGTKMDSLRLGRSLSARARETHTEVREELNAEIARTNEMRDDLGNTKDEVPQPAKRRARWGGQ